MKLARILGTIATLALVILAGGAPARATAPSAPAPAGVTLSSTVQIAFPLSITFSVNAQSDVNVTDLRLHYVVHRRNLTTVVSEGWARFTPAPTVSSRWVWDMRMSGLPPGAQVEYWWTGRDAAGKTGQTERATLSFDDTRHNWQSITTARVTLYWYSGSRTFADALMEAAQQGLSTIEQDVGAIPEGNVRIYIYASAADLQAAQLFAPTWEGGVTFVGYDIIAVGVATSQLGYGQRAVPHELTHWIVGQLTSNSYGAGLPVWLDEGLATYGEGDVNPQYQDALQFAIQNNRLISVRSLSSPFSPNAQEALISYGESNSIVSFLIEKYGKDKMVQLLHVFQEGSGYDAALDQVYGFDQDGLDNAWRQSLGVAAGVAEAPALVLAGAY